MRSFRVIAVVGVVFVATAIGYIYSGRYSVAADVPHNRLTYWLLETLRERSVEAASHSIEVPDLNSPDLLLAGGPDYNEMCAGCHLKPGKMESDMSLGLYPAPPNLSLASGEHDHSGEDSDGINRERFWVIKHGIKASGMPAWGKTHDDQRIWAMVAFLQKLPELTEEQYQILTAMQEGDAGHP